MPSHILGLSTSLPILPQLEAQGIETDQRLRLAIERLPTYTNIGDHYLFLELLRLNSSVAQYIDVQRLERLAPHVGIRVPGTEATPSKHLVWLLDHAMKHRTEDTTLGSLDVFRALACCKRNPKKRPWTLDLLSLMFTGASDNNINDAAEVRQLLSRLERLHHGIEDFAFFVAVEDGRLSFRVASTLADYVEQDAGLLIPRRAVLTHFKDHFGGFTADEIEQLEELMNSTTASEREFQVFFEEHPHFFRRWDYREIYPHVFLRREGSGPLIPDFILTDRELQKALVVELKLPSVNLVRRQQNRDRFASAVMEARAQLLRYRDWFRIPAHRESLKSVAGMRIYEPDLAVVIGRSSDFNDDIDRQQLRADNSDIEIVTYDDIATYARRRRVFLVGDR